MRTGLRMATAAAAFVLAAAPGMASELRLGFGAQDLVGRGTAPTLSVDYHFPPFAQVGPAPVGLGLAAEVDTRGDAWGGGGLVATLPLTTGLRLEASAMPGASTRGPGEGGGARATLRSRIGLDLALPGAWRAGLSFTGRSNGGRGGPGVTVTVGRTF
jgi:hypothetical protein